MCCCYRCLYANIGSATLCTGSYKLSSNYFKLFCESASARARSHHQPHFSRCSAHDRNATTRLHINNQLAATKTNPFSWKKIKYLWCASHSPCPALHSKQLHFNSEQNTTNPKMGCSRFYHSQHNTHSIAGHLAQALLSLSLSRFWWRCFEHFSVIK